MGYREQVVLFWFMFSMQHFWVSVPNAKALRSHDFLGLFLRVVEKSCICHICARCTDAVSIYLTTAAVVRQVFDVVLNGDHTVVQDLDIYQRVGRGVAHDEVVPLAIRSGRLAYRGDESDIQGGKIRVEFIKVVVSLWWVRGDVLLC